MVTDNFTQRDAFGHWLSGFTDGEGCFYLNWSLVSGHFRKPQAVAMFQITLRFDDRAILEQIRSFLSCGGFYEVTPKRGLPDTRYKIQRIKDLIERVIPHFERYPLRAKKARDFGIWKQGVELLRQVSERRKVFKQSVRQPTWTEDDRTEFSRLILALREARQPV